jgi:hypothetical protein
MVSIVLQRSRDRGPAPVNHSIIPRTNRRRIAARAEFLFRFHQMWGPRGAPAPKVAPRRVLPPRALVNAVVPNGDTYRRSIRVAVSTRVPSLVGTRALTGTDRPSATGASHTSMSPVAASMRTVLLRGRWPAIGR